MSWSVTTAGKGDEVGKAAAEGFAASKQYSGSEPHHAVVDAFSAAADAFAKQFPDKIVVIESAGHIDSWYGYANFSVKVFQPPTSASDDAIAEKAVE